MNRCITFSHEQGSWLCSGHHGWLRCTPQAARELVDAGWQVLDAI